MFILEMNWVKVIIKERSFICTYPGEIASGNLDQVVTYMYMGTFYGICDMTLFYELAVTMYGIIINSNTLS